MIPVPEKLSFEENLSNCNPSMAIIWLGSAACELDPLHLLESETWSEQLAGITCPQLCPVAQVSQVPGGAKEREAGRRKETERAGRAGGSYFNFLFSSIECVRCRRCKCCPTTFYEKIHFFLYDQHSTPPECFLFFGSKSRLFICCIFFLLGF